MLLAIILLCVGFVCLYYGAKWLVDGACSVAVSLNLSKVVVGVALVAFGTSAPELFVNLIAAFRGHSGIALSNISGSNLTNICVGFGICAIVGSLEIHFKKFWFDMIFFVSAPIVILFFLCVYPGGYLPFYGSFFLIGLFFVYVISIRKRLYETEAEIESGVKPGASRGFFVFLGGVVTLYLGGEFVLRNALAIGRVLEVSEPVLGLTIVAVGTSLPDVMASIIAIRRNELSIAVGNLLGSNVFNILLVLGVTLMASGSDLSARGIIVVDYVMVLVVSLLFAALGCMLTRIRPLMGALMLVIYLIYITLRVTVLN